MRMKRYLSVLLAGLTLVWLSGCGGKPGKDSSTPVHDNITGLPAQSQTEAIPIDGVVGEDRLYLFAPKYYGTHIIDFSGGMIEFYLLSSKPLQEDQISVETGLAAQSKTELQTMKLTGRMESDVNEEEAVSLDEAEGFSCPDFIARCYRVTEWTPFEALEANYRNAESWERPGLRRQIEELWRKQTSDETESNGSDPANRLPHYLYHGIVYLWSHAETVERLHTITVSVDGIPYALPVGDLYVDSRSLYNTDGWRVDNSALTDNYSGVTYCIPSYSGGWYCDPGGLPCVSYEAQTDLIITSIQPLDDNSDLQLTQLDITVTNGVGMQTSFRWDGTTPFSVPEGGTVSILPTCYSTHMDALSYCASVCLRIGYRTEEGRSLQKIDAFSVKVFPDPYQFYAEQVDGIDLSAYWHYVYNPTSDEARYTILYGE